MDPQKIQAIRDALEGRLKPARYEHSIGVAYTAMALAMRYQCDMEKAGMAGFLHDWAKQYDEGTIIKKCKKFALPLSEEEMDCPSVLHAKLGAYLVQRDFDISDEEILDAIRFHTTGRPDMTLLEMIIYVADYIEPNRDKAPGLAKIRRMAFLNIKQATLCIMEDTIQYLREKKHPIDNMTLQAYSYYMENNEDTEL